MGWDFSLLEWGNNGYIEKNVLDLTKCTSLLPQQWKINKMYDYDVHEAVYLKYKMHGPWVRGESPRAGQIL